MRHWLTCAQVRHSLHWFSIDFWFSRVLRFPTGSPSPQRFCGGIPVLTSDTMDLASTETKLSDLWMQILETKVIARSEPFLCYGDSLSAIACRIAIQECFGIDLPLSIFFDERSSLTDIAALVNEARATRPDNA